MSEEVHCVGNESSVVPTASATLESPCAEPGHRGSPGRQDVRAVELRTALCSRPRLF